MTAIFRDGTFQSVAEKTHPQAGKPGLWTPARWIDDEGRTRAGLRVLVDGVQHYQYAIRIIPPEGQSRFPAATFATFRIERYPFDPEDRGTAVNGAFPIGGLTAFYFAPGVHMDHKGGKVGHAYGTSVLVRRPYVINQFIPKLAPA